MSDFPFQFAIKSNMNVAFNIWQQYCNSTWKIKLKINSIGLKFNQTFQWHLSSPCDIQQPLYLSSSRFCFNPSIVPNATIPNFKTNQALFICESSWTISLTTCLYIQVSEYFSFQHCTPTFILVPENFRRFAKMSLSQIFLTANQFLNVSHIC